MSGDRALRDIALEIQEDWGAKVSPHAEPYLTALFDLNSIDDEYFADSARSVVLYFLENAKSWRGETARRVKAELRRMAA